MEIQIENKLDLELSSKNYGKLELERANVAIVEDTAEAVWGSITGDITTQTDLQTQFTETKALIPDISNLATKTEVNTKADADNVYTKTETDTKIKEAGSVNLTDYYTKQQIDSKGYITAETDPTVPSWAKQTTKPTYTASEVGALPDTTVIPDVSGLATKTELTTGLATKADASTLNNYALKTDLSSYSTTTQNDTKYQPKGSYLTSIPAEYVTETELATGLSTKADSTALDLKVEKVTGKGLSTNDYTTTEKTKLAGLSNYDDSSIRTTIANNLTTAETYTDNQVAAHNISTTAHSDIRTALVSKVDVVSGKGLSTNDFTNTYKTQIDTNTSNIATLNTQVGNISAVLDLINGEAV